MVTLFFGDGWSVLSTVFLIVVLLYIVFTVKQHKQIASWGRKTLILVLAGLILCISVALRDDYMLAVQGGSGLFMLDSFQIQWASMGAILIVFSALSSIVNKNQKYRKVMFFVLSVAILCKICIIEISRIAFI